MDEDIGLVKAPRLCEIIKEENGYGFNLHGEKGVVGQYISAVDPGGPADKAGICVGDRVVEVNEGNVESLSHGDVVAAIRGKSDRAFLLVVDKITDNYLKKLGRPVTADLVNYSTVHEIKISEEIDNDPESPPVHTELSTHEEINVPEPSLDEVTENADSEDGDVSDSFPTYESVRPVSDDNIEDTPSAVIHTDNTPPAVVHTDDAPPAVVHTDDTPSPVVHTDDTPPAVVHTGMLKEEEEEEVHVSQEISEPSLKETAPPEPLPENGVIPREQESPKLTQSTPPQTPPSALTQSTPPLTPPSVDASNDSHRKQQQSPITDAIHARPMSIPKRKQVKQTKADWKAKQDLFNNL